MKKGLETLIGNLLRTGVIISAILVLAGGVSYLARSGQAEPQYRVFQPTLIPVSWQGQGLIQLGLLVLIATPVARVALSILAFAFQRDRLYVVLTALVFGVLLYSLFGR